MFFHYKIKLWSLYDLEKLHNQNLIQFLFKINSTIFSLKKKKQCIQSLNFMIHIPSYIFWKPYTLPSVFLFLFLYILLFNKWGWNSNSDTSYRKNLINTESQHFWKKNHILLYMLSVLHAWFWQYNEKIIEGFIALEVIKVNLIMWNFLPMLHCYRVNLIMCNFLPKSLPHFSVLGPLISFLN